MPGREKSIKATTLVVAAVFTISVSGYFMGMRQTLTETEKSQRFSPESFTPEEYHTGPVQQAVDYSQINETGFGINAGFKSRLASLKTVAGEEEYPPRLLASAESLREERDARRAYDGAPPIVPHPIAQGSPASCLACHSQATQIGDVIAPAISHPEYTSCTQCHVSAEGLGSRWNSSEDDLHTGNQFEGDHKPKVAHKAYPDAPQTIPHTVHMRQNCMSCHGPLGTSPIRTSHPERQSCTQCHVPGGQVDKRNFAESPFPLVPELLRKDEATTRTAP